MVNEQLAWQRKVIREEYLDESMQSSDDVILSATQALQNRRGKRIKRMETKIGDRLSNYCRNS
ncbi:hypothetical protein G4Z05_00570 [Bacillus thermocopriae]|jgi:hypothetical protein|uniref:Uncharacterized protein n=1 Tax=Neobacillus thermocopriae TaxID=1215031 RepID=A0A6B3TKD6_9BACI|nr:hypothetical protein [Neobacillus thermocopriae]NEX77394.1 hypothetical protein [Neobacillus thermocopriae]